MLMLYMLYKYGKRTRKFLGRFYFILFKFSIFWGVFNKTIIPLALVRYELDDYSQIIATYLVWNNC